MVENRNRVNKQRSSSGGAGEGSRICIYAGKSKSSPGPVKCANAIFTNNSNSCWEEPRRAANHFTTKLVARRLILVKHPLCS